jgi:hypothetical protein
VDHHHPCLLAGRFLPEEGDVLRRLGGESRDNPNTPMERIGPAVRWTFFDRATGAEYGSVFVLAQWYVVHRYRTAARSHSSASASRSPEASDSYCPLQSYCQKELFDAHDR